MTARPTYIIGAGGLARELHALIEEVDPAIEHWRVVGFVDRDGRSSVSANVDAVEVFEQRAFLASSKRAASIVLGIGSPSARARVIPLFVDARERLGLDFPTLVHPSASIHRQSISLGEGTVVTAGCVLTTDIKLGAFNLLNWTCTVGHDCRIGDHNVINPGCHISGAVKMGSRNLIGAGAVILQGLTLGDDCVIGAGSVVTRDLESGHVYIGSPARPVRVNEPSA